MTAAELISATSPAIGSLGGSFYFAPATLARGKALGLDGFRFYFLGRGGVLGDVEPPVVTSAFGYFEPSLIAKMWSSAKEVVAPREAGAAYVEACREHGRSHLGDVDGLDDFCAAAGAVVAAQHPAGLALFAGWAAEPLPDDAPARAMQLVTTLREMRGSVHLLAVVASGLSAQKAHFIKRPDDYKTFGYDADAPPEITGTDSERYEAAGRLTDELLVPAYSTLDDGGVEAFRAGIAAIEKALTADPG
jgi:hypothetical protein